MTWRIYEERNIPFSWLIEAIWGYDDQVMIDCEWHTINGNGCWISKLLTQSIIDVDD